MVEAARLQVLPRLELVWADGAYTGPFATWLNQARGWRAEVHFRQRQAWRYGLEEKPKGFQVIQHRLGGLLTAVPSGSGSSSLLTDDGWWSAPSRGCLALVALLATTSACLKRASL